MSHDRKLTAQEKRFEEYVRERGGVFVVREVGDPHHRFSMLTITFEHIHDGRRICQETAVSKEQLKHEEFWEPLLDTLNGTFARALEREVRGVH